MREHYVATRQRNVTYRLMQLALAVFFLILGIQEVVGSQQTDLVRGLNTLLGRPNEPTFDLIVGILAIVSGLLLLLGFFQMAQGRMVFLFTVIIMIYWAIRLVMVRFVMEVGMGQGTLNFFPDLESWLLSSSQDLIILCALWIILTGYSRD